MATQNIYALTDAWNAGGTTFTAIGMNVADTASATGSMLIDLQHNSISLFHVLKSGAIHSRRSNYNITSANTAIITASNYSLTGTNAQSLVDLSGTWNTSGTPTAIKLNMTDTASNAASALMDLQVGGVSQFSVTKAGRVTALGRATIDTMTVGRGGQTAVAGNVAVGASALNSASMTGADNTAVGAAALRDNTTGAVNTAVGNSALIQSTTANNNTAVGGYAMFACTTGAGNTALGSDTLVNCSTANSNTAIGRTALRYFNTSNNTAVGLDAARGSTTVANNTGSSLVAVGHSALLANTSANENTAVGYQALRDTSTGGANTALGANALIQNTTANYNTAVGGGAMFGTTTGDNNTALGTGAGDVITTGARNTIIGANSDPSANTGADQTVVGEGLTGKGDNTAFIGGTNGAYNEKNVTTWETTSDARIKKNIVSNGAGLEIINQIDVRNFEYRTPEEITELPQSAAIDRSGIQLGVIAQEFQAVLPVCVTENSTGVLSVSTDQLIWYLVNAVKQLSAEVNALKGA